MNVLAFEVRKVVGIDPEEIRWQLFINHRYIGDVDDEMRAEMIRQLFVARVEADAIPNVCCGL